jgi:hypothetical protein
VFYRLYAMNLLYIIVLYNIDAPLLLPCGRRPRCKGVVLNNIYIIVLVTTVVDNGDETRFGQTRLFYLRTVVSVRKHNKNTTDTVGLVQSGHHYHLIECNLFSP